MLLLPLHQNFPRQRLIFPQPIFWGYCYSNYIVLFTHLFYQLFLRNSTHLGNFERPLGIAHQHSKVPVPKYLPMTNPFSNLGAGTFKGTIKVKTLTETHSEQKFEASLATRHCPPTLKSPRTKISTYDKSLVKFGRRYFQGDNQSENTD